MLNNSLDTILIDLQFLIPEMIYSGIFLLIILLQLIFKDLFLKILPLILSVILMIGVIYFSYQLKSCNPQDLFFKNLRLDSTSIYFKVLFDLTTFILIVYHLVRNPSTANRTFFQMPEFYFVLWATLIGLHFLAMASSLLTAFLSLEMISISSYILATLGFTNKSSEAGIKYLLYGAVSSCIMVYGMSLLYGSTGSLNFSETFLMRDEIELLGLIISMAGVFFKIASIPFHLWAPDVYEGVPAPVAGFLSIAPKAGGFILLMNMLSCVSFRGQPSENLSVFLAVIAIITICVGNFSALWQNNAKRLFAYSSIAHTGFALGGLALLSPSGVQASLYYLGIYLFMNFAAFLMVDFLTESTGSEYVNKFKGLGMQVPFLGVIFVITMIALTGLPPTAGFYAKFFVFSAMWETYIQSSNTIFLVLFIFGLFNTVVSLFYYLKIPYLLFFKTTETGTQVFSSYQTNIFFCLLTVPVLVLFLKPELLLEYINFCLNK